MRNYLILRERVRAFRADPEVAEALAAARVDELRCRRCTRASRWTRCAPRRSTSTRVAARGMAFERLDQLAMEHLLGVRS